MEYFVIIRNNAKYIWCNPSFESSGREEMRDMLVSHVYSEK